MRAQVRLRVVRQCRKVAPRRGFALKPPESSEHDIQKAIEEYLKARGISAWRQNAGAMQSSYKGKNYFTKFGITGQADITGILPDGRRLEIEVKRPGALRPPQLLTRGKNKGRINPAWEHIERQRGFLEMIERNGGVALFATSVDDVVERLDRKLNQAMRRAS